MISETLSELMDVHKNNVINTCNSKFKEILDSYAEGSDAKTVVSHFGEFSQDLVNSISTSVEEMMQESGDKKGPVKRMFSILVEGLQNVRIHGEKDEDNKQVAFLIVTQYDEKYRIAIGNLIRNNNIDFVAQRIEALNNMEPAEVKEYYMEVLTNGIMSNKGGAGLGFITIAMKSKSKIDFETTNLDDELSCFTYQVDLVRKKKA